MMRLGVVMLPSETVWQEAAELARKLSGQFDLVFKVDDKKLFSHVTLFHLTVDARDIKRISEQVARLAGKHKALELRYRRPGGGEGFFDLELTKPAAIDRLHTQIVRELSPYRTITNRKDLTGLEARYFKQYGSSRILKLYRPHITLGRLKDVKLSAKILRWIKPGFKNVILDNLAVTVLNNQGQVVKILAKFNLAPNLDLAMSVLRRGGAVVYPTDTSYGLAVDATNAKAVKRLYDIKGRAFKKPVHVIFPSTAWLKKIVSLNTLSLRLMNRFLPGPVTLVLPLKAGSPSWKMLSAGTKSLGVRLPKHELALALAQGLGRPITATSANTSGHPDSYSLSDAQKQFARSKHKPEFYLNGGLLRKTRPSTVVSLINGVKILRAGPITEKQIKQALK